MIPLPTNWTDPQSIKAYLIAVFSLVSGALTDAGVTVPAGVSASVKAWSLVASVLIAAAVMVADVLSHRSVHKAVAVAQVNSATIPVTPVPAAAAVVAPVVPGSDPSVPPEG